MHVIDAHVRFGLAVPAFHVAVLAEDPRMLLVLLLLGEPVAVVSRFLVVALDHRLELRVPLIPDLFAFQAYLPMGAYLLH